MMTTSTRHMLHVLKPLQPEESQAAGLPSADLVNANHDMAQLPLDGAPKAALADLLNNCLSQNKPKNTPVS